MRLLALSHWTDASNGMFISLTAMLKVWKPGKFCLVNELHIMKIMHYSIRSCSPEHLLYIAVYKKVYMYMCMFILTFIIMRAFAEALRLLVLHLSLLFFLRLSWLFRDSELIADIESLKSLSPSSVYVKKEIIVMSSFFVIISLLY